ncbi:MAG: TonB family protein [Candidatus Bacteroides intestinipullorum]|uniref:TonB family protein n=1 Tax=Candidatus Bacteroides intestinipullorum TaxID=2838471 RepID=A0A9E2NPB7_9BACE|nr:TonB family protein [Candidatus Bacteroides intestinipullorum]
MGLFLVYILKSSLCLAAFYLFYRLLLSRETLHRFNRMALLGVLLLSAVVPLIEVSTEQPTGVGQGMLTLEEWLVLSEAMPEVSSTPVEEARAVWPLVLLAVYGVGVLFFLGRNLLSLIRLGQLLRGTRREDIRRYVADAPRILLFVHERGIAPFSWMRYIVIARKDLEEDGRPILLHELAHIRCGHSWDLLLADLCCFVQWFNPAAWLLKQELQAVHEYEADEAVLRAGVNAREYQLLLIKKAVGTRLYSMANSLNHSKLKKRITMMQRRKSNPWARAKLFYVLPLAAVAVAAFARPEVSGVSNELSAAKVTDLAEIVKEKTVESVPQDTVKADGLQGKNSTVYDMVEQAPEFPGGPQAMMQFIKDNLKYPQIAKENGIQGRVILQFVVDETGQVTDPKVLHSIDPSLDTEAIRLVLSMPRWIPGMQDGKAVAVKYTFPVMFSLGGEAKSSASKDMPFSIAYSKSSGGGTSVSVSSSSSTPVVEGNKVVAVSAGKMSEVSGEISKLLMNSDSLVILVDGVPATEETLRALSADKIATMSILKDKLDGMAAAKGKKTVIAIATDSGKPSIVVSGAVVDEKGGPILGALVRVVGSMKKGVVTDGQGNFTITVPEGCSLEVSYIDHQTTVVKAQPEMTVTLKAE